jgi:hypothetical protein
MGFINSKSMNKYIIIALSLVLFSCDSLLFEKDQASTNPRDNFDYLWEQCDEKYSFFDLKNIDWDSVKAVNSVRITDDMSDDSLFQVLGDMLISLRDDHTNLISDFNISYFGVKNLGQDNFDWRVVTDNYLPEHYYISGPFQHDFLKNTNNEIGYIRFSAFTGTVNDDNLNFILNRYSGTKGLILDLRENGGGAVTDVFQLLSRFIETETIVYYSKIKTGKAHDDFSEELPANVEPSTEVRYKNKVCVLIDRGTFSAGSFTSLATKAIPNLVLVGDTTGGGLGLPNGGQLPNGWTYRFSVSQTLDLNKENKYENGVPPDVYSLFDWSDMTTDEVIEQAKIELK